MPVHEHYVSHDDDMLALVCRLFGHDPASYGGYLVLLIKSDLSPEGGLTAQIHTDAPNVEMIQAMLAGLANVIAGSRQ